MVRWQKLVCYEANFIGGHGSLSRAKYIYSLGELTSQLSAVDLIGNVEKQLLLQSCLQALLAEQTRPRQFCSMECMYHRAGYDTTLREMECNRGSNNFKPKSR